MKTFRELLRQIANRFDSGRALAIALGMSPSRLSRALNQGEYTFNVENCLKLARLSGESSSEILRAAGKEDVAGLLEELYGQPAKTGLTAEEREVLALVKGLAPEGRDGLIRFLRSSGADGAARSRKRSA